MAKTKVKESVGVDKTLKFAWAYLLLHGKLTDGTWSYYGGCWEESGNQYLDWETRQQYMVKLREKVQTIGIDWARTGVPTVSEESKFVGTFASYSDDCLATLGKLVLLDGSTYLIGSDDNDAAHLAKTAQEMIATGGKSKVELYAETL